MIMNIFQTPTFKKQIKKLHVNYGEPMNVTFLDQTLDTIESDITVIFLTEALLDECAHKELLQKSGFKAKQDQLCLLHEKAVLYCGIEKLNRDSIRSAATKAVRSLKTTNYNSAKVAQYFLKNTQALVEGFVLGFYSFDTYKSKNEPCEFKELMISSQNFDAKSLDGDEVKSIVDETITIATATNYVRDLVNTIPNDITPPSLAKM